MPRKELIRLAREAGLDIPDDNPAYNLEFNLEELGVFVELVKEQQQSWIASLEQNARDADRMYKELETELAEQQKRIDDMNSLCMFNERTMDDMLERLAASQTREKVLREALENCRLLAARYLKEEWAPHILRFCESGGSVANPLRQDDSALREMLKAERERCAKVIERLISGDGVCADDGVWIHDCAEAIRAMEDK